MASLRSGPAWCRLLAWAALGPVLCGGSVRAEPEPEADPHARHLYSAEMLRHGAAAAPHFVMFFAPWWVSERREGRHGSARPGLALRGVSQPASSPVDVAPGGGRAGEALGSLRAPSAG